MRAPAWRHPWRHPGAGTPIRLAGPRSAGAGFSLIEVLVAMVVIAIGLLGLAGLQSKLELSEVDAYQRAQALSLVQDMADRIASNRTNVPAYVTGTDAPLGTGNPVANCSALANTAQDACEWNNALLGAAETANGGTLTGAMVDARGCVVDLGGSAYLVTVVWQGMTPLSAPSAGVACGAGDYGAAGTPCADDLCRRAVSTVVRIGTML